MKFLEYLQQTKEAIKCIKPGLSVHVVIGNESSDLDTMVSSLSLAYHYSTLDKFKNQIVIPIMTKTEKLFPIKVENVYLLNKYGIDTNYLIFRDSLDLATIQNECNMNVTLVDHHVLPSDYKFLKKSVTTIIDHRPIDASEAWDENVFKDIQLVGSCCTLIAKFIDINKYTPPVILKMLYDVITYDTIAYDEKAGKVKPEDLQVATTLEALLSLKQNDHEQHQKYFDEIFQAHKTISQLTSEQLLYKDLKVIANIFVPGLPMLVGAYLQRNDVAVALENFALENNTETLLLMGIDVVNGEVKRDLAIYTKVQSISDKIENLLLNNFEAMKINCDGKCDQIQYYQQTNAKLSRKQLTPLLQATFKDV